MSKQKQTINVKLLRKIKKHILEEPRRFVMNDYVVKKLGQKQYDDLGEAHLTKGTYIDDQNQITKFAKCGTAACIAGWAVLLHKDGNKMMDGGGNYHSVATRLLGFTEHQASVMFSVGGWPEQFEVPYDHEASRKKRAIIAGERIEHMIKTGE